MIQGQWWILLTFSLTFYQDSTILCKSGLEKSDDRDMEQVADKETCSMEYKKAGKKRSTFSAPSERTDHRLEVGPGMQKWKVASEPEW